MINPEALNEMMDLVHSGDRDEKEPQVFVFDDCVAVVTWDDEYEYEDENGEIQKGGHVVDQYNLPTYIQAELGDMDEDEEA